MNLTRRRLPLVILSIVCASAASLTTFWLYAMFRTMRENVGFDPSDFAYLSTITIAPAIVLFAGAAALGRTLGMPQSALLTIAGSIVAASLVGVGLSETMILMDERAFAREAVAAERQGHVEYTRERTWPNAACALVWNRESGIHATD